MAWNVNHLNVQIDTPEEYMGSIIESLSNRKGEMQDMQHKCNGQVRIVFFSSSSWIIRIYNWILINDTWFTELWTNHIRSILTIHSNKHRGGRRNGALVSTDTGENNNIRNYGCWRTWWSSLNQVMEILWRNDCWRTLSWKWLSGLILRKHKTTNKYSFSNERPNFSHQDS